MPTQAVSKTHWTAMPVELRAEWRKAMRAGTAADFEAAHPELDFAPRITDKIPELLRWWRYPNAPFDWDF